MVKKLGNNDMRRAAKIDANQPGIVDGLRKKGISVEPGHDDILVGYQGNTYWFEIKTSPKAEVKPSQKKLLAEWAGQYKIVYCEQDILEAISYEGI